MNQEMGLTEFFAMEAGEYLERLDTLVSAAVGPDRDELLRLTRALRGSALMANQESIGTVAATLESVARGLKEQRIEWDAALRQTVIGAVDGLKILVRGVKDWGDAESSKARKIAVELTTAAGLPPSEPPTPAEPAIDVGTRAFVGCEGASVASVLDRTAKAVQREGLAESQIETVLRSMEPLRGLATLPELSPLPEFLDGVEQVLTAASRHSGDPNDFAIFMDITARGLSKAAQEIATTGTADPESVEAREFTRRLAGILDVDAGPVPIQSLYYEDDGPHVLEAGSPPTVPDKMGQMEFVAHGEHLCQVADGMESAQWDAQREIRLISLKDTLRALTAARGGSLASAVSEFANAALQAIDAGTLEEHTERFAAILRQTGRLLSGATPANEDDQASGLETHAKEIGALQESDGSHPAETEPVAVRSRETSPAASAEDVSEIEIPELTTESAHVAGSALFEEDSPADTNDIAAGWAEFEKLRAEFGDGEASIEELIAGGVARTEQAETSPVESPESDDKDLISITELCYRGRTALEEAHGVRARIRAELASPDWDAEEITELVDELLDLVELGVG